MSDYRCTKYEPDLMIDKVKKEELRQVISSEHPRASNHYILIRKNEDKYKSKFAQIYNYKCAYCGVSTDLIPLQFFDIDHFIPSANSEDEEINDISNLILSCKSCNIGKSNFAFLDNHTKNTCFPDNNSISEVYYRADDYTIQIKKEYSQNQDIVLFYNAIKLGSQLRRLDYLIVSMIGLKRYALENEKSFFAADLSKVIDAMIRKKNTITGDELITS